MNPDKNDTRYMASILVSDVRWFYELHGWSTVFIIFNSKSYAVYPRNFWDSLKIYIWMNYGWSCISINLQEKDQKAQKYKKKEDIWIKYVKSFCMCANKSRLSQAKLFSTGKKLWETWENVRICTKNRILRLSTSSISQKNPLNLSR